MTEYYDENGDAVEGIQSPEEVEAALTAKAEEIKTQTTTELETKYKEETTVKEAELKVLEEKLVKLGDKDNNFANLRNKASETEKALLDQVEALQKDLGGLKDSQNSNSMLKMFEEKLGDKDAAKIALDNYNDYPQGDVSDEKKEERIKNSILIAEGMNEVTIKKDALTPGGGSGITAKSSPVKDPEVVKGVASAMGIDEKELKENNLI